MSGHHVLGVLEDERSRLWRTFDCAVGLAGTEHSRLTLAKTSDPGRVMRWFAPAALQSMAISPNDLRFLDIASDTLAMVAEFVPAEIPVTTLTLGQNTLCALIALIDRGAYDVLVASDRLLGRRRLRRALARSGLRTCPVPCPTEHVHHLDMIGAIR